VDNSKDEPGDTRLRVMPRNESTPDPIRNEFDLIALWETVLPAVGLGQRTLSLVFLDDDECALPTVIPLDGMPDKPDDPLIASLGHIIRSSMTGTPAASVVMLMSRQGSHAITADDRCWNAELSGLSSWPIFLATHGGFQNLADEGDPSTCAA
jgi:hypothetical protein